MRQVAISLITCFAFVAQGRNFTEDVLLVLVDVVHRQVAAAAPPLCAPSLAALCALRIAYRGNRLGLSLQT